MLSLLRSLTSLSGWLAVGSALSLVGGCAAGLTPATSPLCGSDYCEAELVMPTSIWTNETREVFIVLPYRLLDELLPFY